VKPIPRAAGLGTPSTVRTGPERAVRLKLRSYACVVELTDAVELAANGGTRFRVINENGRAIGHFAQKAEATATRLTGKETIFRDVQLRWEQELTDIELLPPFSPVVGHLFDYDLIVDLLRAGVRDVALREMVNRITEPQFLVNGVQEIDFNKTKQHLNSADYLPLAE
jgi:hypothetical protein